MLAFKLVIQMIVCVSFSFSDSERVKETAFLVAKYMLFIILTRSEKYKQTQTIMKKHASHELAKLTQSFKSTLRKTLNYDNRTKFVHLTAVRAV